MIQEITDEAYAQATANGLVVVDFRMDFCPGCERMDAVLTQLARRPEFAERVRFVALSVNRQFRVAEALGVQSAPTLLVKQAGKPVAHFFGAQPEAKVAQALQELLVVAHA